MMNKSPTYFEGILQLRNCEEDVVKFVENSLIKHHVSVAKVAKQKNGRDYYVGSNKFLMQLRNVLPRHFPGEIHLTRKLFSRNKQTGKNLYRLTLLFRQLPFNEGDVINDQEKKVKVIKIRGEKITVKHLATGKTYFLK